MERIGARARTPSAAQGGVHIPAALGGLFDHQTAL